MNNTALLLLSTLILSFNALANQRTAIVTIDGIEHSISLNKETKIKIGSKEHLINIKLSEYSTFKIDGMSFSYNSNMTYNEDTSNPNVSMWNIDGNSNVIMVQKYQTNITTDFLTDMIKQQFKNMKAKVEVENSILKYKKSNLKGLKLKIQLGDIFLSQEIYTTIRNGKTVALIIQDTLNDDRSNSKEYKNGITLLKKTLNIK